MFTVAQSPAESDAKRTPRPRPLDLPRREINSRFQCEPDVPRLDMRDDTASRSVADYTLPEAHAHFRLMSVPNSLYVVN